MAKVDAKLELRNMRKENERVEGQKHNLRG